MPERPHLSFPVALGSGGRLRTVEQGTDEELAEAIAMVLAWPQGTKREAESFGAAPTIGEMPDLEALRVAVERSEPRVRILMGIEKLDAAIERIALDFQGGPA